MEDVNDTGIVPLHAAGDAIIRMSRAIGVHCAAQKAR
jgi:hypothetical protein